jgi:kanosamine-6-phosphate phosphatase
MIFLDLDETIFDHNERSHQAFHALEAYLKYLKNYYYISYGVVTGCNQEEAQRKLNELDMSLFPDFVALGFGTDIYYYHANQYFHDVEWNQLHQLTFKKEEINAVLRALKKQNIHLVKEDRSDNPLKESYYYFIGDTEVTSHEERANLRLIKLLANKHHLKVVISKCNQNIGDPINAYDIDFIPITSGKEKAAQYLTRRFHVDKNNTFGFGDSENDLALLKYCAHGYAVSNATTNLKNYIQKVCKHHHAQGVHEVLKQHFENIILFNKREFYEY